MNPYQQQEIDKKNSLLAELNSYTGQTGYKFRLEQAEGLDRTEIRLNGIIPIVVNYQEYQKTYNFYIRHTLPYVRYETEKKLREETPEPRNVHKLNGKKIKDWIDHLIIRYEKMAKISLERQEKIAVFENTVRALGATIGQKDHYGQFTGKIIRNGIEYRFHVQDEGYISQDIDIHYSVPDSIEAFLALSDNHFTK